MQALHSGRYLTLVLSDAETRELVAELDGIEDATDALRELRSRLALSIALSDDELPALCAEA